jgi:aldose 1-epimerase
MSAATGRQEQDGVARGTLGSGYDATAVTVWMDAGDSYLMLFTGDSLPTVNRRKLAAEPMTCPTNAVRTAESLVTLEPERCWTGEWGIDPRPRAHEAERRWQ